jgi:hypothetical protein
MDKCIDWTYAELQELMRGGHGEAQTRIRFKYGCNEDEATELHEYIQQFMSDARMECK